MPEMNEAASEQRNATVAAISSAAPKRRSGVCSNMSRMIGCCSNSWRPIGVSMRPGASELTRPPRVPQETAARAAALFGGEGAGRIGAIGRQGRFVAAAAMRQFFPAVNTKVCDVIRRTGSSGLVMTVTEGDLAHPDLADLLPTYLRGKDISAHERAAVMKLAWDAVATEFGSRQELYEIFYGGDPVILRIAQFHSPARAECEALVDRLLAENAEAEQTREAARALS